MFTVIFAATLSAQTARRPLKPDDLFRIKNVNNPNAKDFLIDIEFGLRQLGAKCLLLFRQILPILVGEDCIGFDGKSSLIAKEKRRPTWTPRFEK